MKRGWEAYWKGDHAGGVELYGEAKAKDPTDAEAWFWYAECLGERDGVEANVEERIMCFRKVLELDSDYSNAHLGLYLALKDKADALEGAGGGGGAVAELLNEAVDHLEKQ